MDPRSSITTTWPSREMRAWCEEANGSSSLISTSPRPRVAPGRACHRRLPLSCPGARSTSSRGSNPSPSSSAEVGGGRVHAGGVVTARPARRRTMPARPRRRSRSALQATHEQEQVEDDQEAELAVRPRRARASTCRGSYSSSNVITDAPSSISSPGREDLGAVDPAAVERDRWSSPGRRSPRSRREDGSRRACARRSDR